MPAHQREHTETASKKSFSAAPGSNQCASRVPARITPGNTEVVLHVSACLFTHAPPPQPVAHTHTCPTCVVGYNGHGMWIKRAEVVVMVRIQSIILRLQHRDLGVLWNWSCCEGTPLCDTRDLAYQRGHRVKIRRKRPAFPEVHCPFRPTSSASNVIPSVGQVCQPQLRIREAVSPPNTSVRVATWAHTHIHTHTHTHTHTHMIRDGMSHTRRYPTGPHVHASRTHGQSNQERAAVELRG